MLDKHGTRVCMDYGILLLAGALYAIALKYFVFKNMARILVTLLNSL